MNRSILLTFCMALFACTESKRPQNPIDRTYAVRSVSFAVQDGTRLVGELTLPTGNGPHPAVVLLAGSGPQTRDEEVAGHRPFLVLSDALARAGIAALRYDKRGVGDSGGDFDTAGFLDFARDGAAALDWLAIQKNIDASRLGFLGHSEGGMTAPVAARDYVRAEVQAMVLLTTPAIKLEEVVRRQAQEISRRSGETESRIAAADLALAKIFDALDAAPSPSKARSDIEAAVAGLPSSSRHSLINLFATKWGWEANRYAPDQYLPAFPGPVLSIYGSTDLQVAADSNAKSAVQLLGHTQSRVTTLEERNHLLQPSQSGMPSDYRRIQTTIDPVALNLIVQFLQAHL